DARPWFASGLKDAGLPDGHIPTALLFFSIGVEAGHFLFIGFVLSVSALMFRAAAKLTPVNQERSAIIQLLPPMPSAPWRCSGSFNA
ncbi:MAG: HupE/UreJ family protein, partial [Bryobacteraceae bacterium]